MSDSQAGLTAANASERLVALMTTIVSGLAVTFATVVGFVSDIIGNVPADLLVEIADGKPTVRFWPLVAILLILIGILALSILYIRLAAKLGTSHSRRKLERRAEMLQAEVAGLNQAYHDAMRTTGDVVSNWKEAAGVLWRYTKVDERYEIGPDGDTEVTRTYTIEAVKQTSVFRVEVFSDASAEPCALPRDIKFNAFSLDGDGQDIRFTPILNEPHKKVFALFFLPPIEPGETRRFRITHNWPRFAADLIVRGTTTFDFKYSSCEPDDVADVEMEFAFSKTLGEITFDAPPGFDNDGDVKRRDGDQWDRAIWTYKNADLRMHGRRLRFEAHRKVEQAQPAPPPG